VLSKVAVLSQHARSDRLRQGSGGPPKRHAKAEDQAYGLGFAKMDGCSPVLKRTSRTVMSR